jgi:transposase
MQITTIGLDIAKNVFQVHGIDAKEKVVARKQLWRSQVITFFKALPPCLIGMEACATGALLGARADEAGPPGAPNAGEGCEGLRQAQQKRCG